MIGALPFAGRAIRVDEVGEGRTILFKRFAAIEALRDPFFALEPSAVRAFVVDVVGEKMEIYASISAGEGFGGSGYTHDY